VVGPHVLGPFSDGDNTTAFGFYLNKQSARREAAVDFMRFMTSYEGSRLFTENSGWPPATDEVPVPPDLQAYLSPGDGYAYGASYIMSGGHMRLMYARNLHHLAGPQGSVERMAAVLEKEAPEAARADLRLEQRAARTVVLPQDARVAALGATLDGAPADPARRLRRERLEAAQNQSEARALMIASWLRNASSGEDGP
jgi:hypothetical protein